MKTNFKNNLLLAFSLFLFIVACKSVAEKSIVENIPMDKNTAKMVDLQDSNLHSVVALKICFADSICGMFALDNGITKEHCIFDSAFFDKIYTHYPLKKRRAEKYSLKGNEIYDGKISFHVCDRVINIEKVKSISAFSKMNGGIDGIIGSAFFEDNIVDIDYDDRKVSLLESIDGRISGYTPIPLLKNKEDSTIREIEIVFPKVGKIKCFFDLGYPGSLGVKYPIWKSLGLDTNHCLRTVIYQNLHNPPTIGYVSSIDSICINNLVVKNPLIIIQIGIGYHDFDRFDFLGFALLSPAILGRDILSQYNMIIDYQKDTLYLKKRIK